MIQFNLPYIYIYICNKKSKEPALVKGSLNITKILQHITKKLTDQRNPHENKKKNITKILQAKEPASAKASYDVMRAVIPCNAFVILL